MKTPKEELLIIIEKGMCYSLNEIADKFGCSNRTVKRMIAELRDDGHEIKYSHLSQKFIKKN